MPFWRSAIFPKCAKWCDLCLDAGRKCDIEFLFERDQKILLELRSLEFELWVVRIVCTHILYSCERTEWTTNYVSIKIWVSDSSLGIYEVFGGVQPGSSAVCELPGGDSNTTNCSLIFISHHHINMFTQSLAFSTVLYSSDNILTHTWYSVSTHFYSGHIHTALRVHLKMRNFCKVPTRRPHWAPRTEPFGVVSETTTQMFACGLGLIGYFDQDLCQKHKETGWTQMPKAERVNEYDL